VQVKANPDGESFVIFNNGEAECVDGLSDIDAVNGHVHGISGILVRFVVPYLFPPLCMRIPPLLFVSCLCAYVTQCPSFFLSFLASANYLSSPCSPSHLQQTPQAGGTIPVK